MFRNPCHKCIVRAACSKECDIYKKFSGRAIFTIITLSGLMIPFYISICFILHLYVYHNLFIFACVILLIWILSSFIYSVLDDKPDFSEVPFYLRFATAPWIINIIILAKLTRKYGKRAGVYVPQKLY